MLIGADLLHAFGGYARKYLPGEKPGNVLIRNNGAHLAGKMLAHTRPESLEQTFADKHAITPLTE